MNTEAFSRRKGVSEWVRIGAGAAGFTAFLVILFLFGHTFVEPLFVEPAQ